MFLAESDMFYFGDISSPVEASSPLHSQNGSALFELCRGVHYIFPCVHL